MQKHWVGDHRQKSAKGRIHMAEANTDIVVNENPEVNTPDVDDQTNDPAEEVNAEIARLRAELERQKQATNKATKESADYKRQLRAKQSAEEIAAEEQRAQAEERDKELAELRKRFAVAESSKKVMSFVGDEAQSSEIAEHLYGADDPDAVIDALNKAWQAREKKLRAEYGKIPAPGVGSSDGSTMTREQLDAMNYRDRNAFAVKYPQDYERLMGRVN